MDDLERRQLAEILKTARPEILDEIVREAESFLGEQLKAGLAADQRAMNFAVMLAAIVATLVAGSASLIASHIDVWPHIIAVILAVAFFAAALLFTVQAARPAYFYYSGSNPKHWIPDIQKGRSLHEAKALQASFYAQSISQNSYCLEVGHRWLKLALLVALIGTFLLIGLECFFGVNWIAKNGLPTIL
ncbi:MAG: hypothetical protein M3N22_09655 [Acidobacteriota bacterium]|nr:hypothetical protein [Acidobacteriota bacterium]